MKHETIKIPILVAIFFSPVFQPFLFSLIIIIVKTWNVCQIWEKRFYVEIAVSVNKLWWTIFSSCLLKCAFWVARMSQASHGHFFPSCRDCLCLFMIFFQSQWSHKHHMEIVSLYVQIVYASLGILYESHGSHKHHMNISSLHAHIV